MKFASPSWLYFFALVPVLYGLVWANQRSRISRFRQFADPAVWSRIAPELDFGARVRKELTWLVALSFVILALARPQWGKIEETVRATGLDAIVVLDISRSMEVEDVVPSRLKKAKHVVRSMLERMQGDRVGIVAFAGSSYLACPLTTDLGYVGETLAVLGPEVIQNQGSDLGIALETAIRALDRASEESAQPKGQQSASKAIIIISDGEDHEGGVMEQARRIKEVGIRLYVVGVGTEKGGPIPSRDESGQLREYKKTRSGEAIVSSFKPDALTDLARAADGRYWTASSAETEVDELLKDLGGLTRGEFNERKIVTYRERFQIPLSFAVALLFLEWSLAARKISGASMRRASSSGEATAQGLSLRVAPGSGPEL